MTVYRPSSTPPAALFDPGQITAFADLITAPARRAAAAPDTDAELAAAVALAAAPWLVHDTDRDIPLTWDGVVWRDTHDAHAVVTQALTQAAPVPGGGGAVAGPHIEAHRPTPAGQADDERDEALAAGLITETDTGEAVWADTGEPYRPLRRSTDPYKAARAAGISRLLPGLPLLRRPAAAFDATPGVVACPGGDDGTPAAYLRLTTDPTAPVQVTPPDRDLLITRAAGAAWRGGDGSGSRWAAFVGQVFPGDADMQAYVRRVCGVALAGGQRVDHLPVLVGRGGNGKSVLLEGLLGAFGDLGVALPPAVVTGDGTDEMMLELRGRRLAVAAEPARGQWDAEVLKRLSGGDSISARGLYQRRVTFEPSHLLVIASNVRPRIAEGESAFWRRYAEWAFPVSFRAPGAPDYTPGDQPPDPDLPAELAAPAERSAIIAWCAAGWADYVARGARLDPPAAVTDAVYEARADANPFAAHLREVWQVTPPGAPAPPPVPVAAAYALWAAWKERDTALTRLAPNTSRDMGRAMAAELRIPHHANRNGRTPASVEGVALTEDGRELAQDVLDSAPLRGGLTAAARSWLEKHAAPVAGGRGFAA